MKRATYRHRNSRTHTAIPELIHTFWVGQRVIRSHERRNYVDLIAEEATVAELPKKGSRYPLLAVTRDDGTTAEWTPTEATPYRVWADRNAKRLRRAGAGYTRHLGTLDENGHPIEETS